MKVSGYDIQIAYSQEDMGFIAAVPDLPGCCAFGIDEREAVIELKDAISAWLEADKAREQE